MNDFPSESESSIPSVMNYGTPAAKAEVIVRLIMVGNPDLVQKVFAAIGEKELNRIVGIA